MKTLLTTLLFLFFLATGIQAQEKTADQKIVEGIYQEEVTGDLDKAATIFNDVLKNCAGDRIICARALYHLGLVAEKKTGGQDGKKAESYYVQLIEKYPDAGEYTDLARNRLSKLRDANTFIDPRDGHKYRTVKIGSQVWMAENLAYMPHVNPNKKQEWGIWVYDYDGDDVAAAKATGNYQKYGCLYDWAMAMDIEPKYLEQPWNGNSQNHQGICPPGWHLPMDEDWKILEKSMGLPDSLANDLGNWRGKSTIGRKLKSSSGWNSDGNGDGSSKFDIVPAGARWAGRSVRPELLGYEADFWSSTEGDSAELKESDYSNASLYRDFIGTGIWKDGIFRDCETKQNGYSVRCIKSILKPGDPMHLQESALEKRVVPLTIKRQPNDPAVKRPTPDLLWVLKTQPGWDVFPEKNIVFYSTTEGMVGRDSTNAVYKINAADIITGKLLWSTKLSSSVWGNHPAIENGIAYFCTFNGTFYGISLSSGQIVWENKAIRRSVYIQVLNNVLYKIGPELIALDLKTNNVIWKFGLQGNLISGFVIENDRIYATVKSTNNKINSTDTGPTLCALRITNGEKLWEYSCPANQMMTLPIISDSLVCFWNENGYIYGIDKVKGIKAWRSYAGAGFGPELVKSGSFIYAISMNKSELLSVDSKLGNVVWSFSTAKLSYRSPLIHKNQVILFDDKDKCAIGVDQLTGKQLWEFQLPGIVRGRGKIENDRLFVFLADGLYCYDLSKLK